MNKDQKELLSKVAAALDQATKEVEKDLTGSISNLELFVILEIINLGVQTVLEVDENK